MQKILRKRIFRDLRENFLRYLALGFLIILGMYIIISLVAAADTIISGTQSAAAEHQLRRTVRSVCTAFYGRKGEN